MIYIIGNQHFNHHRGRVKDAEICPHCGLDMNYVLRTRASWVTFFFIPIFPYRFQRQLVCPYCDTLFKVDRARYDELLKNRKKDRIRKL